MTENMKCNEGQYVSLLMPGTERRKIFGLLEKPDFPAATTQASYKLYVCGRPGSGKTWARSRLAGREVCSEVSGEEAVSGIEANVIYWPMKISGKSILFRLELWEAGEWSVRRYDHILPACRDGVNGVLLCFSINDSQGWQELPRLLATSVQPGEKATVIPLATRTSESNGDWEASQADIKALEERCNVTVLRMPPPTACNHASSRPQHSADTLARGGDARSMLSQDGITDEIRAIEPILSAICLKLWQKEQELLMSIK
ncbi:ciliogenesis and planar polarity effector 2 [Hyalella azteca]|uniref:Ciliogenesis and planar polarity effector 2 n=1 Tax=Hyalella azteca TaxID=294128 RepID=A0A8B7P8L2_HYAAZ|nr:ciliogenesis and planar polarity effector 2 [Hyalella azteca]